MFVAKIPKKKVSNSKISEKLKLTRNALFFGLLSGAGREPGVQWGRRKKQLIFGIFAILTQARKQQRQKKKSKGSEKKKLINAKI